MSKQVIGSFKMIRTTSGDVRIRRGVGKNGALMVEPKKPMTFLYNSADGFHTITSSPVRSVVYCGLLGIATVVTENGTKYKFTRSKA